MFTRREFLRIGALVSAGFVMPLTRIVSLARAQLPTIIDPLYTQPILDPAAIPKFVTPLPNPLTPGFILSHTEVDGADFYAVSMRQFTQQVLPAGFPVTTVWGYGDANNPATFSYPGHTIVAHRGTPVKVRYSSELPATHLLPVDTTPHCGPNTASCAPTGRTIVHLHGGHVGPESDGYPEAWFTADGQTGPFFNPEPFDYSNDQEAATLWFHDHALGITRLNVYAGLAAFYILRDDNEAALGLPQFPYEVPIVMQDRVFYPDGSLAYPNAPAPSIPGFEEWPGGPSIVPEFFGNTIVVNGQTWPFLEVEPRKYRIRFLNGSEARFYRLLLSSGQQFFQIGTDGGFLNAPVAVNQLTMSPAERADVILDFAPFAGQTITLRNTAKSPFPAGAVPNPNTTGQIMQFRVTLPLSAIPDPPLPANLRPVYGPIQPLVPNAPSRQLILFEGTDEFGRLKPLLGTVAAGALEWDDDITENPAVNSNEVWEIHNTTPDTHPIHIHEIQMQIVSRQGFQAIVDPNTGALTNIRLRGQPKPPDANEAGWKDTIRMNAGEVTRVIAPYDRAGLFVWHCHILDHEDHEMMRPYRIGPTVQVAFVINPGSEANIIAQGAAGTVPVAILSAPNFDATTINPMTVTLAGAPVVRDESSSAMAAFEDVNGNGRADLVVHVDVQALQLAETDTEAILEGETFEGVPVRGRSEVRVVPLAAPELLSSTYPVFTWSAVPGATCYEIQLAGNSDFTAPLQDATVVTETLYNADSLAPGQYYWRVRVGGVCVGAAVGPWSQTAAFTVAAP